MDEGLFRLEFSSEPQFISTARLFAGAVTRHFGFDETAVQDVKIAISEACTNAVKAHASGVVVQPVRVHVQESMDEIEFRVIDAGGGFVPDAAPSAPADDLLESGVGLRIIHSLFPGAEVGPNGEGGTTVRFALPRPAA